MDAHAREILLGGGIRVDELLERCMGSEALLVRLLKKFPADSSFARLEEAFGRSDENAALEASHTLKGVCGNLSVVELFEHLDRQVHLLREHRLSEAAAVMPDISRTYHSAVEAIEQAFS